MSFFDKIYDIAHTDLFKYVFHSGRDKVFVANVSKISTFNEKVNNLLKVVCSSLARPSLGPTTFELHV